MNPWERAIQLSITVNASVDEVWDAWTTKDGIAGFFAPDCNIELEIGGAYEMFFIPDAERGSKGSEGNIILAIQPKKMLSFTWNAPPNLPTVREQRTHVTLRLEKENEDQTKVFLHHDGWGDGGEWDKAFDYFTNAWGKIVLPRLKQYLDAPSAD